MKKVDDLPSYSPDDDPQRKKFLGKSKDAGKAKFAVGSGELHLNCADFAQFEMGNVYLLMRRRTSYGHPVLSETDNDLHRLLEEVAEEVGTATDHNILNKQTMGNGSAALLKLKEGTDLATVYDQIKRVCETVNRSKTHVYSGNKAIFGIRGGDLVVTCPNTVVEGKRYVTLCMQQKRIDGETVGVTKQKQKFTYFSDETLLSIIQDITNQLRHNPAYHLIQDPKMAKGFLVDRAGRAMFEIDDDAEKLRIMFSDIQSICDHINLRYSKRRENHKYPDGGDTLQR